MAEATIGRNEKTIEANNSELIQLKTQKAEHEAKIELLEEKKATLEREINLKNKLVQDLEARMKRT